MTAQHAARCYFPEGIAFILLRVKLFGKRGFEISMHLASSREDYLAVVTVHRTTH